MNEGKVDCEINGSIASIFFDRLGKCTKSFMNIALC